MPMTTTAEQAEEAPAYLEMIAVLEWARDEGRDLRCGWCRRAPATVPDHHPPLNLSASLDEWKQKGGLLFPACRRCKRTSGGEVETTTGSWVTTTNRHRTEAREDYKEIEAYWRQAGAPR